MHFHLRDHFHFDSLHWDKEESARIFAAALGLIFMALLATAALYLAFNIHDYH